eukprot:NODE_55_length_29507_cov_0.809712.p24 type:complete len:124 gc:universal NODE_55_length_29507_cov_0.809712:9857-9486(-)
MAASYISVSELEYALFAKMFGSGITLAGFECLPLKNDFFHHGMALSYSTVGFFFVAISLFFEFKLEDRARPIDYLCHFKIQINLLTRFSDFLIDKSDFKYAMYSLFWAADFKFWFLSLKSFNV